nr:sugar transferase [Anaerolineaceae bacterium]
MFFDIIFSGIGLLLLSPLLIIASGIILISDGCPIFFRQTRVGINGSDFLLNKFRTMSVVRGAASGTFDAGDTSRITKVGAFLRKTKLDE